MGHPDISSGGEKVINSYVVYDSKTGEIKKTVCCTSSLVEANTPKGFFAVKGKGNSQTHKVVNGQIVDKTETEINNEKEEKEIQKQQRQEQLLLEKRALVAYELSVVDPNVISLLKKLNVIPFDL